MASLVDITGTGLIESVEKSGTIAEPQRREGASRVKVDIVLDCASPGRVTLIDAHEWWATAGGWIVGHNQFIAPGAVRTIPPPPPSGTFFGVSPQLDPGSHAAVSGTFDVSDPLTYIVYQTTATEAPARGRVRGRRPEQETTFAQVPFSCDAATDWSDAIDPPPAYFASAPPPPLPIPSATKSIREVFLAAQPPDVVDLVESGGDGGLVARRHLIVSAQIVNWFKDDRVLSALKSPAAHRDLGLFATLHDAASGEVVLAEDCFDRAAGSWRFAAPVLQYDDRVAAFTFARRIPDTFTFGQLELELVLRGVHQTRTLPVSLTPVDVLHWPIAADWAGGTRLFIWNGVADDGFNAHTGGLHTRYAHDILLALDWSTTGGRPRNGNVDFIIFGKPVLAVADGVVRFVKEDTPDSFPADGSKELNRVYVEHRRDGGSRYSVYAHLQEGSATRMGIAPGDEVQAGQPIAQVGNNGSSSEPHLHLGYYTFDPWGRYRTLPMAFSIALEPGGAAAVGVQRPTFGSAPGPLPSGG